MKSKLILILLAYIVLTGCQKTDPHAQHAAAGVAPAPMPTHGDGFSLYHLSSRWTDQDGTARDLASLRGRTRLIALVYTNCGYACPRTVANMKRIETAIPDAGFVLVSIDPERDTEGRLKEFMTGSRLDPARYTLLRGSDADLLELAAALGVRYRKVENGEFVHSNVITVLDAEGNIVHRQEGFDAVDETIAFLRGPTH